MAHLNSIRYLTLAGLCAGAAVLGGCGGSGEREAPAEAEPVAAAPAVAAVEAPAAPMTDLPGRTMTLDTLPFELAWDLRLSAPVHTSWYSANVPELVFFQLMSGEVQAVELATGMTRWVTRPLPKPILLPPFVARTTVTEVAGQGVDDDRLYVISGDHLFCFDAIHGQLIWRHHLAQRGMSGFQPSSGPFAIGFGESLRVFVGDWEGRTRVITYDEELGRSYVLWQWNLQAVPTAPPRGMDNEVYVVDHSGQISAFALERDLIWQVDAHAPLMGSALPRGRSLYVGGRDNVLHVLNRLSGRQYGKVFLGYPITRAPFAFNREPRRVYVWSPPGTEGAGLYAIHTADDTIAYEDVTLSNGEPRTVEIERLGTDWFLPGVSRLVGSSPTYLYLTEPNSFMVLAANRETGAVDWHWNLAEQNLSNARLTHVLQYHDPTDEARSVITIDAEGRVLAYRLFGQY